MEKIPLHFSADRARSFLQEMIKHDIDLETSNNEENSLVYALDTAQGDVSTGKGKRIIEIIID